MCRTSPAYTRRAQMFYWLSMHAGILIVCCQQKLSFKELAVSFCERETIFVSLASLSLTAQLQVPIDGRRTQLIKVTTAQGNFFFTLGGFPELLTWSFNE